MVFEVDKNSARHWRKVVRFWCTCARHTIAIKPVLLHILVDLSNSTYTTVYVYTHALYSICIILYYIQEYTWNFTGLVAWNQVLPSSRLVGLKEKIIKYVWKELPTLSNILYYCLFCLLDPCVHHVKKFFLVILQNHARTGRVRYCVY